MLEAARRRGEVALTWVVGIGVLVGLVLALEFAVRPFGPAWLRPYVTGIQTGLRAIVAWACVAASGALGRYLRTVIHGRRNAYLAITAGAVVFVWFVFPYLLDLPQVLDPTLRPYRDDWDKLQMPHDGFARAYVCGAFVFWLPAMVGAALASVKAQAVELAGSGNHEVYIKRKRQEP